MEAKLINLTPHDINVVQGEKKITIPKEGIVVRVEELRKEKPSLDGYKIEEVSYGDVLNMPAPQKGVLYIVSNLTATALQSKGRTRDILIPGELLRDEKGQIVGTTGFYQLKPTWTESLLEWLW